MLKAGIILSVLFRTVLLQTTLNLTSTACPPCKEIEGDPNLYIHVGDFSGCSDNCLYRYEGDDLYYCFTTGVQKIFECSVPEEYFIVAGGVTSENTALRSVIVYGSDLSELALPDLPLNADSVIGGIVDDKILLCISILACFSWSKSNPTIWMPEVSPPSYSQATAVTTDLGVWFSGGMFVAGKRLKRQSTDPLVQTFLISSDANGTTVKTRANVDLTTHRFYHCAIENGNSPILTGGVSLSQIYFTLVERYNLQAGTVDVLPSLNIGRNNHGCTKFKVNPTDTDYALIVGGGWNGGTYTDKVEVLYPGSSSWVYAQDLPQNRLFTGMVNILDTPLLVGGAEVIQPENVWEYRPKVLSFNNTVNSWNEYGLTLNPERRFMAVFNIPRRIMN